MKYYMLILVLLLPFNVSAKVYHVIGKENCESFQDVFNNISTTFSCKAGGVIEAESCLDAHKRIEDIAMCCKAVGAVRASYSHLLCADPDPNYHSRKLQGSPGAIKLKHVKGEHTCWSDKAIGYRCDVEVRDATDCDNGHARLKNLDCCLKGKSVFYMPKGCSSFL